MDIVMLRWCIFSVSFLTLQPECLALVLGQIRDTVGDTVGLQRLPAPSNTSAVQVADISAPLRPEKKKDGRRLTSLSAAPMNALDNAPRFTASSAKLESHPSEANFESVFPGWGDTIGLESLPAPSRTSAGQVADVLAPVRPEEKTEEGWMTSFKLESPRSDAIFERVFPEWALGVLSLAETSIIIGVLLAYFWFGSRPPAADAMTQFEKISFDSART